jgi:bile acid:Na+ symporter, BASS family
MGKMTARSWPQKPDRREGKEEAWIMNHQDFFVKALSHFIHKHFLWFIFASYILAGLLPGLGLWIRAVKFGEVVVFGQRTTVSLPILMLAFLLLNAGLGVQTSQLRNLLYHPRTLLFGLVGNLIVPIAFIFCISQVMRFWHNPDEVQNILVGLALVASMPIAGSSTAWSQNCNGDLALSLGLVLLSTFLSPLTTPLALHGVGFMTTGDYSEDLHELAAGETGSFLAVAVIVPSALGIMLHWIIGEKTVARVKPELKLSNSLNLLLLNYSNASVALPQVVAAPDWDFLAVTLSIVVALCIVAFLSGLLIAKLLRVDVSQQIALMFGLGMNNNGTGLVLASMALADHPDVLLPIIFYNLVQHLVAGCVDPMLTRP